MRKTLAIILATLTLASCGSVSETNSSSSNGSQSSKQEGSSSEEIPSSSESSSTATYKVTFQNYDGTFLYETEVEEGKPAVYVGETPTKPVEEGKVDYTYEFVGWDKDLQKIFEDTIATAIFEAKTEEGWGNIIWF